MVAVWDYSDAREEVDGDPLFFVAFHVNQMNSQRRLRRRQLDTLQREH